MLRLISVGVRQQANNMSQDHTQENVLGSEHEATVDDIITKSYLDNSFQSKWQPIKKQFIQNKTLEQRFEERVLELEQLGRGAEELEEKFGFVVENDPTELHLMCSAGLQVRDSEYNTLGYNKMGVYLCKHADVCLQHSLIKFSGSPVIRMLIFKYISGKCTTAIPRVASAAEYIEPTQGFDAHVSVIPPRAADSLQNQFDRSQVYLYEINKLLQPTGTPRQLAPYAIIVFTQGGAYHPLVDAAPLPTPVKFNTPQASPQPAEGKSRLQQIINTINSRGDPPGVTTDCVRGPESPLAAAKAPVSPSQLSDQGRYLEGMPITMSVPPLAAVPPTVFNGKLLNPELEKNQELKRIVDQINARLESDVHKAAIVDSHTHGALPTAGLTVLPPGGGSVRSPVEVATLPPPMTGLPALQTATPAGMGLLSRTHSLGLPANMAAMNPLDNTHLLSMQSPSLLTPQNGLMSHQPTMISFPSAGSLGQPITSDGLVAVSRAPHLSQLRSLSCPPTDLQFVTSGGLPPSTPTMLMGNTNAYAPLPAVHVSVPSLAPSAGLFNAMPGAGAYVSASAMPSYAVQDTALLSSIVGKDLYKFNFGHLQAAATPQHSLMLPEEGYYDPYYKLQMNELQAVALQNSQLLSQGMVLRQPLKRTLAASAYTAEAVKKPKYC